MMLFGITRTFSTADLAFQDAGVLAAGRLRSPVGTLSSFSCLGAVSTAAGRCISADAPKP